MAEQIRVLLVHTEPALQDSLLDLLEEVTGGDVRLDRAPDRKRAQDYAKTSSYELIIAQADIPYDRKALSERKANHGIELLRFLREHENPVPFVLISQTPGDDALALQGEAYVQVVHDGTRMQADIADCVPKLLVAKEGVHKDARQCVQLDITLDMDERDFSYELSVPPGEGPAYWVTPHALSVDLEALEEAIALSSEVSEKLDNKEPDWESKLLRVGKQLTRAIFDDNPDLLAKFYDALRFAGSENPRIRFIVEKRVYPAILEAVFDKASEQCWMLRAPVYRRLRFNGVGQPLFKGPPGTGGRLNCLIVESDVHGHIGQLDHGFDPLANVHLEAEWLYGYLKENKDEFWLGEVEWLRRGEGGHSFREELYDRLTKKRNGDWDGWHLVHYAGHSYYDGQGKARRERKTWATFWCRPLQMTSFPRRGSLLMPRPSQSGSRAPVCVFSI